MSSILREDSRVCVWQIRCPRTELSQPSLVMHKDALCLFAIVTKSKGPCREDDESLSVHRSSMHIALLFYRPGGGHVPLFVLGKSGISDQMERMGDEVNIGSRSLARWSWWLTVLDGTRGSRKSTFWISCWSKISTTGEPFPQWTSCCIVLMF